MNTIGIQDPRQPSKRQSRIVIGLVLFILMILPGVAFSGLANSSDKTAASTVLPSVTASPTVKASIPATLGANKTKARAATTTPYAVPLYRRCATGAVSG